MKQHIIAIVVDADEEGHAILQLQHEINGLLDLDDLKRYGKPGYHTNSILSISVIGSYAALVLITCVKNK